MAKQERDRIEITPEILDLAERMAEGDPDAHRHAMADALAVLIELAQEGDRRAIRYLDGRFPDWREVAEAEAEAAGDEGERI
jgi:hypothetical protein